MKVIVFIAFLVLIGVSIREYSRADNSEQLLSRAQQENTQLRGNRDEIAANAAVLYHENQALKEQLGQLTERGNVKEQQAQTLRTSISSLVQQVESDSHENARLRTELIRATSLSHGGVASTSPARPAPAGVSIDPLMTDYQREYDLASPGEQKLADKMMATIKAGGSIQDYLADPYVAQMAKSDPLLQAVIGIAQRKNGE